MRTNHIQDKSLAAPLSPELWTNLRLAFFAIQEVKKILIYGADNRVNPNPEAGKRIEAFRNSPYPQRPHRYIALAEKYQAGRCGEHTELAYFILLSSGKRLEIIASHMLNHCFLIIGREPNSKLNNHTTWGRNAVVCDPWANRYYPAEAFEYQINDSLTSRYYLFPTEAKYFPDNKRYFFRYKNSLPKISDCLMSEEIEPAVEKVVQSISEKAEKQWKDYSGSSQLVVNRKNSSGFFDSQHNQKAWIKTAGWFKDPDRESTVLPLASRKRARSEV